MGLTFLLDISRVDPSRKKLSLYWGAFNKSFIDHASEDGWILASSLFSLLFIDLDFDSVVIKCKILEGPLENSKKRTWPMHNTDQPS